MNPPELIRLANAIELDHVDNFALRVKFAIACVERVAHLITDDEVRKRLAVGRAFAAGECGNAELATAAAEASDLARSHPGSNSIDGTGSAAVSSTHGLAAALAGRALEAAGYTAYASVYSYASHAVTDLSAYQSEHEWQISTLGALAGTHRETVSP